MAYELIYDTFFFVILDVYNPSAAYSSQKKKKKPAVVCVRNSYSLKRQDE